ncbi:MAG: ATP-binding protein [Chitinispirillaceae bacterium]
MDLKFPYQVKVKLPSDLEYIPSIRKFVSEVLQVSGFSSKFAFRSEIIVDEICNNAINYGNENKGDSEVELICEIHEERIELLVKDEGGNSVHTERLKQAVKSNEGTENENQLGLEIVKMLSEKIDLKIDEKNNVTSIHVIRKREKAK